MQERETKRFSRSPSNEIEKEPPLDKKRIDISGAIRRVLIEEIESENIEEDGD